MKVTSLYKTTKKRCFYFEALTIKTSLQKNEVFNEEQSQKTTKNTKIERKRLVKNLKRYLKELGTNSTMEWRWTTWSLKLFCLPDRTGRLVEGTALPTGELPTPDTLSKFTLAGTPGFPQTPTTAPTLDPPASIGSCSTATSGSPLLLGDDSIENSSQVWVATACGASSSSAPHATDTMWQTTGLSKPCNSRGTKTNSIHCFYIAGPTTMRTDEKHTGQS